MDTITIAHFREYVKGLNLGGYNGKKGRASPRPGFDDEERPVPLLDFSTDRGPGGYCTVKVIDASSLPPLSLSFMRRS